MKLPLKYGIPLLVGLWLASGYTSYGEGKTVLMILAMGTALWTAFSLPHPRRGVPEMAEEEEQEQEDLPPEVPYGQAGPLQDEWTRERLLADSRADPGGVYEDGPPSDSPANGRGHRRPAEKRKPEGP